MLAGKWERPYTREEAVYPAPALSGRMYLSPVRRIDQAYGDRHLVCSCPPPEAFADADPPPPTGSEGAGAPDDLGTTGQYVDNAS
jgi:glycine dehydrogenase